MRTLNYKTLIHANKEKMNVIYEDLFESFKTIIILICQTLGLVGPVQQKMKLPLPNCHQILTYQQPFLLLSRNLPDFKALPSFFPVILSGIRQNYLLS